MLYHGKARHVPLYKTLSFEMVFVGMLEKCKPDHLSLKFGFRIAIEGRLSFLAESTDA